MEEEIQNIKEILSNGESKEAISKLKKLHDLYPRKFATFPNIEIRYNKLQRLYNKGIIPDNEYLLELNKINDSLLNILEYRELRNIRSKKKAINIGLILVLIIIIIFLSYLGSNWGLSEAQQTSSKKNAEIASTLSAKGENELKIDSIRVVSADGVPIPNTKILISFNYSGIDTIIYSSAAGVGKFSVGTVENRKKEIRLFFEKEGFVPFDDYYNLPIAGLPIILKKIQ